MSDTQNGSTGQTLPAPALLARMFYCAIPNRTRDKILYVVPVEIQCRVENGHEIITKESMQRIESTSAYHKTIAAQYGVMRADDPEYLEAIAKC